jgi:hypothetical protein
MKNTVHTQSLRNVFERQSDTANGQQPRSGVWQDKYAPKVVRAATTQPVTQKNRARTRQLDINSSRTKNYSRKRQTVQIAAWVKPSIKAELQRIAMREGLSVSQTCGALLEEALQQNLYTQHTALLDPIIEKAIRKHMRSYSTRLAVLLVRSLFTSEQTRSLTTNVLGRQPGVTPKELNDILDGSSNAAKRNITHVTPQLTALVEEVEKWMQEGEKTNV